MFASSIDFQDVEAGLGISLVLGLAVFVLNWTHRHNAALLVALPALFMSIRTLTHFWRIHRDTFEPMSIAIITLCIAVMVVAVTAITSAFETWRDKPKWLDRYFLVVALFGTIALVIWVVGGFSRPASLSLPALIYATVGVCLIWRCAKRVEKQPGSGLFVRLASKF